MYYWIINNSFHFILFSLKLFYFYSFLRGSGPTSTRSESQTLQPSCSHATHEADRQKGGKIASTDHTPKLRRAWGIPITCGFAWRWVFWVIDFLWRGGKLFFFLSACSAASSARLIVGQLRYLLCLWYWAHTVFWNSIYNTHAYTLGAFFFLCNDTLIAWNRWQRIKDLTRRSFLHLICTWIIAVMVAVFICTLYMTAACAVSSKAVMSQYNSVIMAAKGIGRADWTAFVCQ